MISQKAKYALRAMFALAQTSSDAPMRISDIAETQAIPKKFLEQILLELRNAGLIASRRGKMGGYQLLKSPDAISIGEVMRIVDGPLAPLPCLSLTAYRKCEDCENEENCRIRKVYAEVADATRDVLDRTSIADAMSTVSATNRAS